MAHKKKEEKKEKKKSAAKKTARPADSKGKKVVEGENVVISSKVSYQGPLFRVTTDCVRGPDGHEAIRDVIRHNGSVVILGVDDSKSRKDPRIILERQYRHAASQYLFEIPAGKLEKGEDPLEGAKRELLEETGYSARRWTKLIKYFASPGFLGESMQVFLAEGLTAGEAQPEEDEYIQTRLVPLSKLIKQIEAGKIVDGKTIVSVLLYSRYRKKKK